MAERMGINFFTNTLFIGLSGFLISPGKGFFYYSPVAILFFFSIKPFLKKHLLLGISFILIMLSYLLFLSKYVITLRSIEKVQFIDVRGDGVQPMVEPPIATYFNWHKSPILAQFRFIYDITKEIKRYWYSKN